MIIVPSKPNQILFVPNKFENWRPSQRETVNAIVNSPKRIVCVNAPTGSGKSLVGISSVGLLIMAKISPETPIWEIFTSTSIRIITKSIPLQKQYYEDFKVPYVIGREHFVCRLHEKERRKADSCPFSSYSDCPLIKEAIKENDVRFLEELPLDKIPCDYVRQREEVRRSVIGNMNFHFFYYSHYFNPEVWKPPSYLIIDEAHAFPDALSDIYSLDIDTEELLTSLKALNKHGILRKELIKALESIIKPMIKHLEDNKILWIEIDGHNLTRLINLFKLIYEESPRTLIEEKIRNVLGEIGRIISEYTEDNSLPADNQVVTHLLSLASLPYTTIELKEDTIKREVRNRLNYIKNYLKSHEDKNLLEVIDKAMEHYSIVEELLKGYLMLIKINKLVCYFVDDVENVAIFLYHKITKDKRTKKTKEKFVIMERLIFPHKIFKKIISRLNPEKIILMSATIFPDYIDKMLGLSRDVDYTYIEVPSLFPKEHRPLLFIPKYHLNKDFFENEELIKQYIADLDQFMDIFNDMKGIIHMPNIAYTDLLYKYSKHKDRFIIAVGKDRDKKVKEHKESPEPTILVSPSLWEGIDLKDDHSRFQIIFKIPFADLNDPIVYKRYQKDRKWYKIDAMIKLIQGYGRSTRSEKDWSITLLMDRNLIQLLKELQPPTWFKDAIIRFRYSEHAIDEYPKLLEFAKAFKEKMSKEGL